MAIKTHLLTALLSLSLATWGQHNTPVADLLDVQFQADGSAVDLSPMKMNIMRPQKVAGDVPFDVAGRMVVPFSNQWGAIDATTSFRIDYYRNEDFKRRLADGHSLELVACPYLETDSVDRESKPFSAHEGGGTGLAVAPNQDGQRRGWSFVPITSVGGAHWTVSGIEPQSGRTDHIVGVWDKEAGQARIYVNGKLMQTVEARGNLNISNYEGSDRFFIGANVCAPFPDGNASWSGTIAVARIYDKPLTDQDVAELYRQARPLMRKYKEPRITRVRIMRGLQAKAGVRYPIDGKGFRRGDRIEMRQEGETPIQLPASLTPLGVKIVLPQNLNEREYQLYLVRGKYSQHLGTTQFVLVDRMRTAPEVIAHQGYYDLPGMTSNTSEGFQKAVEQGYYGSETDCQLTADGVVVIRHDNVHQGININESRFEDIRDLYVDTEKRIKMPTLQQYLDVLKAHPESRTKLVLEVKRQPRAVECVDSAVAQIRREGLEDRVDFISFDKDACRELARLRPSGVVAYLDHDLTPAQIKELGCNGIDKAWTIVRPEWYTEAHEMGMSVNIWTPDNMDMLISVVNRGADFVTTNSPRKVQRIRDYYLDNQE